MSQLHEHDKLEHIPVDALNVDVSIHSDEHTAEDDPIPSHYVLVTASKFIG